MNQKVEKLSGVLQTSEDQCQQLKTEKRQIEADLNQKLEELPDILQAAESEHAQLIAKKNQTSGELAHKIEELSAALQVSEEQRTHITQTSTALSHKVDGLSDALRAAEEQHTQLEDRKNRAAAEYVLRIKDLSNDLHTAKEQQQQLTERANQAEQLHDQNNEIISNVDRHKAALQESIEQCQSLEDRAHTADKLESENAGLNDEIDRLNSELHSHASRTSELQIKCTGYTNDYEVLKLSMEEKDRLLQQLEEQAGTENAELAHKLEELTAALHTAEEQNLKLQDEKNQTTTKLTHRIDKLSGALSATEEQRQQSNEQAIQAVHLNNQTVELQHEVERLAADLQAAEQQRETLEQRASQADDLSRRVEQLSGELLASEEQCQQLTERSAQSETLNNQAAELENEVNRLTSALQLAKENAAEPADNTDSIALEDPDSRQEAIPEDANTFHDATDTEEFSKSPVEDKAGTEAPENISGDLEVQDPLTGLLNRQGFLHELEEGFRNYPESSQEQSVLYILLDNFTNIREAIGVAASDKVVVGVSRLISENSNSPDKIARFGDCVFTILHHSDSVFGAQEQSEKLLHAIEEYVVEVNGQAIITTASIGICVINDYTNDTQSVLNRADLACEVARSSGGNQQQTHSTIIDEQLSNENMDEWDGLIRKTLDDERFYLAYQPIVSLGDDLYKRYEVLLRIVDEDGKIVLPGKFISLAESLGLIQNIDRWVIDSALKKLAESGDCNLLLFIKLSANTLQDLALPRWIRDKLTAYSLNSANVVFEIPEGTAINNLKHAMLFTKTMKKLGCMMALEHYAATTQPQLLKHIEIDYLKIDGALISNLGTTKESRTAVRAIVDRARQHNLKCVAERVDSATSLALLWEVGVDFAQGNFIQEPGNEIDYDFFGEIETQEIPGPLVYQLNTDPQ